MPTYATNKKAHYDYEILEKFEAGLVLDGQEVKSVRNGQVSLAGAYVVIDKDRQVSLLNASISLYKMAGPRPDYDPTRSRKVLLRRSEINHLSGKIKQTGLTLVPLSLYTKSRKIKLEIGLAKGKKKFDKRESIKEREQKRHVRSVLKRSAKGY